MKRIQWMLAGLCVSLAAATALPACTQQKDVYATLNDLLAQEQTALTLDISVDHDEETLTGKYTVVAEDGGYRVTYSYEKLNLFTENSDGSWSLPDEYKSTVAGNALIKDGEIVEQSGAELQLSADAIRADGVRFDASYFQNVVEAEGSFLADVTSPSAFLQTEIACQDMKIEVRYSQEQVSLLQLSYRSEQGAQVVIRYTFGA